MHKMTLHCLTRTVTARLIVPPLMIVRCIRNLSTTKSNTTSNAVETQKSAVICIIGDEILSGKTLDTNSNYLAKSLFNVGVGLRRIETIPDEESDIIDTIRRMSSRYDYVFTSGGIGPTHDDITYESIAKAFDLPLRPHQPTIDRIQSISPHLFPLSPPRLRMVQLPAPSQVIFTPNLWVPLCKVNNVHILPGIPRLFQAMIDNYLPLMISEIESNGGKLKKYWRRMVKTTMRESEIADGLREIQTEVSGAGVKIGSYPVSEGYTAGAGGGIGSMSVVVSIAGKDELLVDETARRVKMIVNGNEIQA